MYSGKGKKELVERVGREKQKRSRLWGENNVEI